MRAAPPHASRPLRVLVTGGAGYVGAASVERLVDAGHEVVVLDDLSTGHRAAVDPRATFIHGDMAATGPVAELLRREAISAILHCAGRSLVAESVADPARYWSANVAGSLGLLEAARIAGVTRLVFSSSAAVYGHPRSIPISEDDPIVPRNPYGETKAIVERALAAFSAHGLRSIALRYFNVAGATERVGEWHSPETHLIPAALAAADGSGPPLTIFGDDYPTPDGTCVRDYIAVTDLAEAHLAALMATDPADQRLLDEGPGVRALNLGTGRGVSVAELLEAVSMVTGRPVPCSIGPRRPGDPATLVASAALAGALLGWEPHDSDLEPMLRSAHAWRQRHPNGYRPR